MKEYILLFYFSLHLLVHYEQERGMLQEGLRGGVEQLESKMAG
jgi:hypothetical protein